MVKQFQALKRNGELTFNMNNLDGYFRTVFVEGELDGGLVTIDGGGKVVRAAVPDGGPFGDSDLDQFGRPIRAVSFEGNYKQIFVKLSGAGSSANIRVEVL